MKPVENPVSVPDAFATICAALKIDPADEILSGCLLTHGGQVVHPQFRDQSP